MSFTILQGEITSFSELINQCTTEQQVALQEVNDFFNIDHDTEFHSLEGGLTRAKLYTFEVAGKQHVLRFLALGPNSPLDIRQNEIQALRIGASLKIAPKCIFSDQQALLVIMPFITGRPLINSSSHELTQLGEKLRKLHNYPGSYPTKLSIRERLARHYKKGIQAGIAYPTGFDQEIQSVLNKHSNRLSVPSHGDLNSSNILVTDEELTLIDWTNATREDPYADLSYFCALSNLTLDQEFEFLQAYFDRTPTNEELQILKQEKANVYLTTATIWLRFSETEEEHDFAMGLRIAALDAELRSASLKLANDYIDAGLVVNLNTAPKADIKSYALSFYKAYLKAKYHD